MASNMLIFAGECEAQGLPPVDQLFTEDGNTWTSAGRTAATDMALVMVERDVGRYRQFIARMVLPAGGSQREPRQERSKTTLEHFVQWGHFRQTRDTRVSIEIAADGAVEIDSWVVNQDESYY